MSEVPLQWVVTSLPWVPLSTAEAESDHAGTNLPSSKALGPGRVSPACAVGGSEALPTGLASSACASAAPRMPCMCLCSGLCV